jgi:hypothetical protein
MPARDTEGKESNDKMGGWSAILTIFFFFFVSAVLSFNSPLKQKTERERERENVFFFFFWALSVQLWYFRELRLTHERSWRVIF